MLTIRENVKMKNALKRCNDMLDIQGWRYSKELGMDDYKPIDLTNPDIKTQYYICINFLKQFFPKAGKRETVSSWDLRDAAEVWWLTTKKEPKYIDNGIMILAIITRGLAPNDLWYSMEIAQQARIPIGKWKKFCIQYNYKPKIDWESLNYIEDPTVLKIK